jgi:hypothetical protein
MLLSRSGRGCAGSRQWLAMLCALLVAHATANGHASDLPNSGPGVWTSASSTHKRFFDAAFSNSVAHGDDDGAARTPAWPHLGRVSGVADPANVVRCGIARFTVLSPTMVRMELAETSYTTSPPQFEDRARCVCMHLYSVVTSNVMHSDNALIATPQRRNSRASLRLDLALLIHWRSPCVSLDERLWLCASL